MTYKSRKINVSFFHVITRKKCKLFTRKFIKEVFFFGTNDQLFCKQVANECSIQLKLSNKVEKRAFIYIKYIK